MKKKLLLDEEDPEKERKIKKLFSEKNNIMKLSKIIRKYQRARVRVNSY